MLLLLSEAEESLFLQSLHSGDLLILRPERVMYVNWDGPPKIAATSMRSTRSPSINIGGRVLWAVRSIITLAVIRLVPAGRLRLAVAVEEATVPLSAVLCTTVGAPICGSIITCTVVFKGMFDAASATLTGLL